ncbi:hypothetical protein ACIOKD_12570 [Streptomyces sp. NPDC087844]|uniref:hypothetical protein n=1 Tax=Streptomyces sp. NPDC087844 TaxID=3365805 RepID=UPI0037FCCDB4
MAYGRTHCSPETRQRLSRRCGTTGFCVLRGRAEAAPRVLTTCTRERQRPLWSTPAVGIANADLLDLLAVVGTQEVVGPTR